MDAMGRILTDLPGLEPIAVRPLFGGYGIYWRDVIFGIIFRERLYLEVDDQSKGENLARGLGPFRPNQRQTLKSYFEVPPEVVSDAEALLSWAREAIRAGMSSQDPAR